MDTKTLISKSLFGVHSNHTLARDARFKQFIVIHCLDCPDTVIVIDPISKKSGVLTIPKKRQSGPPFKTGKRTNTGRSLVKLPGEDLLSSELSITVTHPHINKGKPSNIPSIFGGLVRSERESVNRIVAAGGQDPETGRKIRSFSSINEAIAAAVARSRTIKPGRKPLTLRKKKP